MKNAASSRRREADIGGSYPQRFRAATWTAAATAVCVLSGAPAAGAEPSGRPPALAEAPAGELVARTRAALSASRPVESAAAHTSTGVIRMNGVDVGTVETVARRSPPAMREVMELAGVRQVVTLLGREAWIEDTNGAVRPLTGEELRAARAAHGLLFHLYLDERSDAVAYDRESRFTLGPDGVRELRVAADGLPESFHQSVEGSPMTTRFSDWREVDGIMWPFEAFQSSGDSRFDMRIRTTEAAYPDTVPDGAIPVPAVGVARDFEFTDPDGARAIPVEFAGALVLVPVEVNGRTGTFLLDTGAGATVLAPAFADRLALPKRGLMEARGAGGSEAASFVDVESFRVPGLVLRNQTVVSVSLDHVDDALGRTIDGILGYDFLSRFAVELAYADGELSVLPPGSYVPEAGMERIPIRIESNVPRVTARLDDRWSGSFLIDTGNNWPLLLHSPFVREHGLAERTTSRTTIAGVGGQESMRQKRMDSLDLGGRRYEGVSALLATSDTGAVALGGSIGNIGGGLFADAVLAFDYSEGSLWIPSADSASGR